MSYYRGTGLAVIGILCGVLVIGGAVDVTAADNVYDIKVTPLTVADCASCHFSQFSRLKEHGARHSQVLCMDCHRIFHAYNPLRNNYAQIMPKCGDCHDAPHGTAEAVAKCLSCHQDPHQPLASIPAPADLEGMCRTCHAGVAASLTEKPSLHTELECSSCHSEKHGRIPQCSECHEAPHGTAEAVMQCANCHTNPHQPVASIPAPAKLENQCRTCHGKVAAILKEQPSKHTEQKCSSCHSEKHGRIPQCAECHESHSPAVKMSTVDCLVCHPVHSPLRIAYPKNVNKEVCGGCHSDAYNLLEAKKTRHSALTCAFCHPSHGKLMACQDCHGLPHSNQIHTKFKVCGSCHNIAHNLQK